VFSREFCQFRSALPKEGAGNAGRSMRPQPGGRKKWPPAKLTTSTPETPSIPRTMVYGLLRALPGDRALLAPSLAKLLPPA
jgi:hypothetical protein